MLTKRCADKKDSFYKRLQERVSEKSGKKWPVRIHHKTVLFGARRNWSMWQARIDVLVASLFDDASFVSTSEDPGQEDQLS